VTEGHVQEHIALVAKHEQEFLAKRSLTERIGDTFATFAGSLVFVEVHLIVFAGWITVNVARVGRIPHFDPRPFSLLGTVVGLEAILLVSFILMRQSRIGRRADERDHLMLQMLLLVEKELTAVLGMERQIATKVGLFTEANTAEVQELSQQTSVDDVKRAIERDLPTAM
jgi:uncharacterized membrane protein